MATKALIRSMGAAAGSTAKQPGGPLRPGSSPAPGQLPGPQPQQGPAAPPRPAPRRVTRAGLANRQRRLEPRAVSRERGPVFTARRGADLPLCPPAVGAVSTIWPLLRGTGRALYGPAVGLRLGLGWGVGPTPLSLHILPSRSLAVLQGVNTGG